MTRQLGLAACGLLIWLGLGWQLAGTGQAPPGRATSPGAAGGAFPPAAEALVASGAAGEMIGFAAPASRGGQLITLINTSQPWMAVYHVDGTGQIHLLSSRPISQDFAVEYNATVPLPKEMREIANQ